MSPDREPSAPVRPPKLLEEVRQAARLRHFSPRTEKSYVAWIRRYIRFHALQHPRELGAADVTRFLASLAEARRLSAASQTQALSAVVPLQGGSAPADRWTMDGPGAVPLYRAHFPYSDVSRQTLRSQQRHFGRLFLTVNGVG